MENTKTKKSGSMSLYSLWCAFVLIVEQNSQLILSVHGYILKVGYNFEMCHIYNPKLLMSIGLYHRVYMAYEYDRI